jgi:hypothetical protein
MEQLRGLIEEKVRIKVRPYGSSYEQLVVDISAPPCEESRTRTLVIRAEYAPAV